MYVLYDMGVFVKDMKKTWQNLNIFVLSWMRKDDVEKIIKINLEAKERWALF